MLFIGGGGAGWWKDQELLKLFPGESSGQFHEAFRNFPSRPNGMQYFCRYEREVSSLKDVLASLQSPADNDIAQKISEYETTVADYEVQVGIL